jgi:SAM-dependent methyltransferase
MKSLRRILDAYALGGPVRAAHVLTSHIVDAALDRKLGIRAAGLVPIETLVTDCAGLHDYYPSSFRTLERLLAHVPAEAYSGSFVDVGSGMGRVLVLAARRPFRSVVGIEISEALNSIARDNLARVRSHLKCQDLQVLTADAATAAMPDDATVFYFYNPFHGAPLSAVLSNIKASLTRRPRVITVIFNNTRHMTPREADFPWLWPVARLEREHMCTVYRAGPL